MGSSARKRCQKLQRMKPHGSRNNAARDELGGIACRCEPACIIARELIMRNRILAIAAIAGAIGAPIAAQAQTEITTGVVRGGSVIVNDDIDGIAVDQRPAFREYIVRERVPNYAIPDRVIVARLLPETRVTS